MQRSWARFQFHSVLIIWGLIAFIMPSTSLAGSLLISWAAVADSRVAGYKIKYGTASKSYSSSVNAGNVTQYTVGNLIEGVTYYFVIVALDAGSIEGMPSTEVSGTVLNASGPTSSPVTSSSVTIGWQTNKVSDSQVIYGLSTGYGLTTVVDPLLIVNHSQLLTNLSPQTTYHFQVRSKDEGGSVSLSGDHTFTTQPALSITTLSPSFGRTGIDVVIRGMGFGNSRGVSALTFSGVSASIKSWAGNSITAIVPVNAKSGPVIVTVNAIESNGMDFKINGKLGYPRWIRVRR